MTPVNQEIALVVYTKENDDLFSKLPDSDRKITSNNKLEYISDDEFKLTSEISVTFADSKYNEKIKTFSHCTRIK